MHTRNETKRFRVPRNPQNALEFKPFQQEDIDPYLESLREISEVLVIDFLVYYLDRSDPTSLSNLSDDIAQIDSPYEKLQSFLNKFQLEDVKNQSKNEAAFTATMYAKLYNVTKNDWKIYEQCA